MEVYVERVLRTDKTLNAVTESLMMEALEQAGKLDKKFAKTGKLVGPRQSFFLSVKDAVPHLLKNSSLLKFMVFPVALRTSSRSQGSTTRLVSRI